ncbi:MAG TPA: hypothetical protein VGM92_12935 [Candidatus Kapabacteria bacterium]
MDDSSSAETAKTPGGNNSFFCNFPVKRMRLELKGSFYRNAFPAGIDEASQREKSSYVGSYALGNNLGIPPQPISLSC